MDSKIKKEKETEEETKGYLEISFLAQIFRGLVIDFLYNITLKDNIGIFILHIKRFYNFILRVTCIDLLLNSAMCLRSWAFGPEKPWFWPHLYCLQIEEPQSLDQCL